MHVYSQPKTGIGAATQCGPEEARLVLRAQRRSEMGIAYTKGLL